MEFWNNKTLHEPPTYTYKSTPGEVDIDHLHKVLQDGIDFFNEQNLMNQELALLTRVIYIMKARLRNSKDFKTLERVKRDLIRFTDIEISNKMEHLASTLPLNRNDQEIYLPTKNMIDFILVRLQGIGKILCRTMELCKLSAEFNECRLRLGHYWNLALLSLGIVSRIHILSLHILKFTCLFYVRLLPYSNKLKNTGANWLPNNYTFPKDLKEWLNIDWDKLTEVIEIKDSGFDKSFFDLCDDSDDDIEFCNEYVEVDKDDVDIIEDLKHLSKRRTKTIHLEDSVIILRGFATDSIDTGEVILSSDESDGDELKMTEALAGNRLEQDEEEVICLSDGKSSEKQLVTKESMKIPPKLQNAGKNLSAEEIDIEKVSSYSDVNIESPKSQMENDNETEEASFRTIDIAESTLQVEDLGEIISSSDEDISLVTSDSVIEISEKKTAGKTIGQKPMFNGSTLLISSDEESVVKNDDIVESVPKQLTCPKQRPGFITCDFIPLGTNCSKDFSAKDYATFSGGISQKFNRNSNKISEVQTNKKGGNIANFNGTYGSSCKPKKRSRMRNRISKVNEKKNSGTEECPQENVSIEESIPKRTKHENTTSNSGTKIEISEIFTRKRKRSKSGKSNVLNEIPEQLSCKDSLPSQKIGSSGLKKRKKVSNEVNKDVPDTSIVSFLKKNMLKKKKENELNEKQLYLQNKKYLARRNKRLKKKQLKQGML